MTDAPSDPSVPASGQMSAREAVDLVQAMGQSLNTALLYGVAHKVASASLDRSFPALAALLQRYGQLHVSIVDGDLLINGASAHDAPLTGNIIGRLTARNLLSFVMESGLSREEYQTFFSLLITAPAKDGTVKSASDTMEDVGIRHIAAQNVTYRRVTEGEAEPAPVADHGPAAPEQAAPLPATDLANVMAFLKGDPSAVPDRGQEDLRQLSEDAEKLADLILRTANVREQAMDLGSGESLTDLVVGCINRLTETLTGSPVAKTQKGRKQIKRNLLLLEDTLLAQLQSLAGDALDRDAVSAAFRDTTEGLDVESLAAKYMKSRRASEKAEAKMKKLIEQAGGDPLQEDELRHCLMDQGLSAEGWRGLMVTREPAPTPTLPQGTEPDGIKTLTLLLAQLGDTLSKPKEPASGVGESTIHALITETGEQMQSLAAGTKKKIDALQVLAATASAEEAQGKTPTLSRKALLEMLAEIAQELSQPLTIVNATLDMLRGQRSGPITPAQGELLALATESGIQLGHLVSCLMKIAGTPASLHPDRDILREAYRSGGAPATH